MSERDLVTPICCGGNATWVDHGPGCCYWYCKDCKNEVAAPMGPLEDPPMMMLTEDPDLLKEFEKLLKNYDTGDDDDTNTGDLFMKRCDFKLYPNIGFIEICKQGIMEKRICLTKY